MAVSHSKASRNKEYGRAGRYVRQPAGYDAFIPAPLPPRPPVRISGKLQVLLSDATLALGRLDGSIHTLPNPELFVLMYVRKEAVLSSQIEGTQSSLQDVLAAEAKVLDPSTPQDVDEVLNYISAMNYGLRRLKELPVSVRLIKELHERLMKGVRGSHLTPGETRRSQNWIGPGGASLKDALFVPPPPDAIAGALGSLENFLHAESGLPLLIQIGLAHAQFETIHPFLDGNGRVGRLLITFLLRQRDVLQKPVLYLSHFLKRNRQEYYERLQRTRDEGDWEGWLGFFLTGVAQVSGEATETARRILALREKHRNLIAENLGRAAGNGHRILETLYRTPITNVKAVGDVTGTSFAAANQLVGRLARIGILREMTGQRRNRSFRYHDYIELFT
jgi:Fic family protein